MRAALAVAAVAAPAAGQGARTADMPDSWLVLYNVNNADSVAWAVWYAAQWGIPSSHLVGLDADEPPVEHLGTGTAMQTQIILPVRNFLSSNPTIEPLIMGIVVGYGLPGSFGTPTVQGPEGAGYSVANALQDLYDDTPLSPGPYDSNLDNPRMYAPYGILPSARLTRATMAVHKYMTARIDGPTVDAAKALTLRAKSLSDPHATLHGSRVCYDYYDASFPPSSHEWLYLKDAAQGAALADLPWSQFDLRGIAGDSHPAQDAFRFDIYKLYDWTVADFASSSPGPRVLAYELNSYGSLTVRSTTTPKAVFVPNALAGGYAAAIGATGEPCSVLGPFPDTLLAALREGWTLGEAHYLASPFDNWMWNLVGDPLLRLPNWFNEIIQLPADVNHDGAVNRVDYGGFGACLRGLGEQLPPVCATFDLDQDGDCDLADYAGFQVFFTGGGSVPLAGDFDRDGDADMADFTQYPLCQTIPDPSVLGSGCDAFDLDFDLDVDLQDFAQLSGQLLPAP